jgi:hypothetical protein
MFISKKGIIKIFIKNSFIKLENPYPRPNYGKKNENNKNGGTPSTGFIILINGFGYIVLGGFV